MDLSDIEKFSTRLKSLPLGTLVDQLICLRIEDSLCKGDDANVTSVRVLKIKALKKEISLRQVSKDEDDATSSYRGVSSLGNLFG